MQTIVCFYFGLCYNLVGDVMKKILLIIICLVLVTGCKKNINDTKEISNEEEFILTKINKDKEYVYFDKYRDILANDGNTYEIFNVVINVDSEEVINANLELKSFVSRNYKNIKFENNVMKQGTIISYDYYVSSEYVSVIQKYFKYLDGNRGEERDNVYVISLKNGKVLKNEDILSYFGLNEQQLFKMLEEKIDSDDVAFSLMSLKKNGYNLFVNNSNEIGIIYYEVDDLDSIRKELVLN